MEEEEKINFRLVLPNGISDLEALDFMNELRQSDIPGMGNVSFVTAPDEDNTMGGALDTILGFVGKTFSFESFLEFIKNMFRPVHVKIISNVGDKGPITSTFEGEAWTKRALTKLNEEHEKFLKITNENKPQHDMEFNVSSIIGEDGKTVSTFDAQGLTSRTATKAIESYKEFLENSQVKIVVSSK